MGPSVPKIFRDDFFTRMGPSVRKIFRDDFFTRMGPSVRKIFRDDFFSREWDHLCPRYLGVMFHPSGTICAQNVRFYIEATLSVHGENIFPVCCFPAFPQLFAFPYTYFHLTCSFLLACRFSTKWDDLCPRYLEMIFHANGTIFARVT